MNIRDLKYLIALAEHKHFGRAADASFVSQPTLSTQIKKLEDELNIALFERDNKNVMVTEAGQAIVERARKVLEGVDDIKSLASRHTDPFSGDFRLGAIPTIGPYLFPKILPRLVKTYPKLNLQLHEAQTAVLTDKLEKGEIDAAIMAVPVQSEKLHYEDIYNENFMLAMPKGHALEKYKTVPISALSKESVLLLEEGHCLRDQALEYCGTIGTKEIQGFQATSMETLKQMVAIGAGITFIPETTALVNNVQNITIRSIAKETPSRQVAMYYRKSSVIVELITAITETIKSNVPTSK